MYKNLGEDIHGEFAWVDAPESTLRFDTMKDAKDFFYEYRKIIDQIKIDNSYDLDSICIRKINSSIIFIFNAKEGERLCIQ